VLPAPGPALQAASWGMGLRMGIQFRRRVSCALYGNPFRCYV